MYTRRKFVIQSSMATTAVLALKPFHVAAETLFPIKGTGSLNGKLMLLHTANPDSQIDHKVIQHIAGIQNINDNAIVLQAGPQLRPGQLAYDFSIDEINQADLNSSNYKIIRKGNIKTGLIIADPHDDDVLEKVKTLSSFLKQEKNCDLVVCLSRLGYKNKNAPDDIMLAKKSTHLDLIIGGNPQNAHQHPVIVLNENNEEVIIHSSDNNSSAFGKIEIDFNEHGQKNHVSFSLS